MKQLFTFPNKHFFLFSFFALVFLGPVQLEARHIIGGSFTYRCLGAGKSANTKRYEFVLKMYRDTTDPNAAPFDAIANITIFRPTPQRDTTLRIAPIPEMKVLPPSNPCFILPGNVYGVRYTEYRFTVELQVINSSYVVSYQRCCRTNNITNLVNPSSQGATYTIELTPLAQQSCNSSPDFNAFPPTALCVNEPFFFDHSATDADGDQLVYEFCAPFQGGGQGGGGNCNSPSPNPACPPPYNSVVYQTPTFNSLLPIGGNPAVVINPVTGVITGTPNIIGQFVVGVCVKEYRNGQLLSTVRRDFQFNVVLCKPLVTAKVASDTSNQGNFTISTCGKNTVTFLNQTPVDTNVKGFLWQFNINGTIQSLTTRDATISFPNTGTYKGTLIVNPNIQGCTDTAFITANIYPPVKADFGYAYDTCIAGPVAFTDKSQVTTNVIRQWRWDTGDSTYLSDRNPVYDYQKSGKYNVKLAVKDNNGCRDSTSRTVTWFPVPPIVVIEPSRYSGCIPAYITFNSISKPVDSTYSVLWKFGDGDSSRSLNPTHVYRKDGVFSISLDIVSPIGCKTRRDFPNFIRIDPAPKAAFTYSPDKLTNFKPTVQFNDQSFGAAYLYWSFNNKTYSYANERNPLHTFTDTGLQTVKLVITHKEGCQDSAIQKIDVVPEITYFLPNALSPNEDGVNELFRGAGYFSGIRNFTMTIWSRWGEKVFESNDPNEGWNGRRDNSGEVLPDGTYAYTVRFNGPRGTPYEYKGTVQLIK